MTPFLIAAVVALAVAVVYLATRLKKGGVKFSSVEESESESVHDPVTGVYSRAHLIRRLQEMMARCDRDKKPLALVLWDVDGFVEFNNEHGAKEGDRLLRQVAEAIKKSVRVYDEIFRAGPDEFSAVLTPADPEVTRDVTRRVAEIVSKALFDGDAEYAGKSFSITSGFVFYPNETERSADALLHAANQALYKSRMASTAR